MLEKILKIISVILIINSLVTVVLFVVIDEKFGGNVLNCQQIENEYAIANKNGDIKIVSKRVWQVSYILTVLLYVAVILGILSVFYLFVRYVFLPNTVRTYKIYKSRAYR